MAVGDYKKTITNVDPYWDDFTAYRNFLRVLYKPGRAVQARELTQMQTATSYQIEQMANHLFADGSSIIGAKVEITKESPYIEILAADVVQKGTSTQISDLSTLIGQHIQAWTADPDLPSGTLAKIVTIDSAGAYLRMQLDYRGGKFAAADKFVSVNYADTDAVNFPIKYQSYDNPNNISAVGSGIRARVEPGIVYINGFFVNILEQEIFVNKVDTTGTFVIGYEFEELNLYAEDTTILDPVDGVTELGGEIRDPANSGGANIGPPGADRYMVVLHLRSYEVGVDTIPTTFHQIIKLTNGVVEEKIDKTEYADILNLLAERTYDESGSYTVEPYSLLASWLDANNFNYEVGPGKSYIFGYQRENLVPVKLSASKTRVTRDYGSGDLPAENRSATYGTYVIGRQAPNQHTFDASTDITGNLIAIPGHSFGLGDKVTYSDGGGTPITGLTSGNDYYVIVITKNDISLASTPANATAGTAITLSGSPTGTQSFTGSEQARGAFDATAFETAYLMSGYSGTGSVIGTTKVWFMNDVGSRTRIYLGDDTKLLTDLQEAKSLCSVDTGAPNPTSDDFINIDPFDNVQAVGFNQPIIPLKNFVKEVTNLNYTTLLRIQKTVTASPYTLGSGSANDTFASDPYDSIAFVVKSDGEVIDPVAGNGVFGTAPTGGGTDTIQTAGGAHSLVAGTYDFYMIVDRVSAIPRTKTLTEPAFFDLLTTGTPGTKVIFNGTTNGSALSAAAPTYYDVAAIESIIRDPAGDAEDVTESFLFDDGQKDLFYDYSSISGAFASNETYRVTLHYWNWGGSGDFFAANSYSKGSDNYFDDKGGYERNLPYFLNDTKTNEWVLRDCLDFRRNITEISTAREIAAPLSSVEITYKQYLPRFDKIWIDRQGKLGVTQGVPEDGRALSPPPDKSGTVTLFQVYVSPYLYDPIGTDTQFDSDQVNIRALDHKNYTMDDIRKLEQRITGLEYYSSELQLELDAYSDTVVDAEGFSRAKNGFFVDKFINHLKGSVWDPTYRCSMDPIEGALRCPYEMNHIQFEYDNDSATEIAQTNNSEKLSPWANTITLGVSSIETWVEQPLASEYMNINPFAVVTWAGEILMNPLSDTWIETRWAPTMQIQDPIESEKILALYAKPGAGIPNWGAWSTQVIGTLSTTRKETRRTTASEQRSTFGKQYVTFTYETVTTTNQSTRTGTYLEQTGTETIVRDMGERTLDVSSIPWMRSIDIDFEAHGLRPETTMVPYFADVDVSASVVWHPSTPGGVTKKNGYLRGTFTVPEKTFRTGKNIFTLKDSTVDPLSIASAEFRAEGTLFTKAKQILSVEVPTYSTRTITETQESITAEENLIDTRWFDPISQTFLVEDEGGVFLESIDIFFATKDRYLPVSLYIVETIAGIPGQKRVPFSFVTKEADDIVASRWDATAGEIQYNGNHYDTEGTNLIHNDGDTVAGAPTDFIATNFAFSDPVYLKDGVEYAFVLVSNSNNYHAYISRMGTFDIISGDGIDKQPHLGSLLKSQNASTWTPDQYADIKFRMNRCDFDNSASALYMRVKGTHDYWDDIVYAPGEQIIYDHSVDGLSVYECLVATIASSGENPEAASAKWFRVEDGFYNATLLNISTDELIVPGTSIVRQYLSDPDTSWLNFTNKNDIEFTAQDTIELYTDAQTQNPTAPKGINLKLQLATTNTWLSPVINKGRSFGILVNNLTRDTDADAPASHTTKLDSGEYISETSILKQNAASLKLLIDVAKPNADAIIVPKYRTIKEDIRYLLRDSNLVGGENVLSEQVGLKDSLAYVYQMDLDIATGGLTPSVWEQKGTVIVDGLDDDNGKVFLSSIQEPADFMDKATTAPLNGYTNPWTFITNEPDILIADVSTWDGTSTTAGDYAFNPSDKNLYIALVDTVAPPTQNGSDWELVPGVFVNGVVQYDTDVEWRPMTLVSSINPGVDTTNFVEYEYEPLVSPSEEFDNFAIKIEMYAGDPVNVPVCKRLRTIAVN